MAKQTFSVGQVLSASAMQSLQETAMGGGSPQVKTASYTLVAADAGTVIQMNSASATTITVNTNLFSAGDSVQIQNIGSGTTTITAGTATVNSAGSLAVTQYDGGFLYFSTASSALWFDYTQAGTTSPLTTKGDLYTRTSSADARLGVGANGTVLTADSAEATGLKWAAAAGGGKVLQVVQGTLTSNVSTSSASLVDTGLTVSITPSSATSKIYVAANLPEISAVNTASATGVAVGLAVLRGATKLQDGLFGIFGQASSSNKEIYSNISFSYLDSPATTSSTTYKVQYVLNTGTTAYVNASATKIASIIVFEIGA